MHSWSVIGSIRVEIDSEQLSTASFDGKQYRSASGKLSTPGASWCYMNGDVAIYLRGLKWAIVSMPSTRTKSANGSTRKRCWAALPITSVMFPRGPACESSTPDAARAAWRAKLREPIPRLPLSASTFERHISTTPGAAAKQQGLRNLTFETGDVRQLPFPDGAFDIVWTKYLLQWVTDPMRAMGEFARVLKPGGLLVSANFDGFAVTHEPPDPAIQPMAEFVFAGLVDPFIGRKMAGMCRASGLTDIGVCMEVDRVFTVIGPIDPQRRRNWEIQWSGARHRAAELLGSKALAEAFFEKFIAYQDRPDTATYCTLYVVSARKPA